MLKNIKVPFVFAVSGVKNSGKTTVIKKLVKELNAIGFKVAVLKHDGHDFSYDVPNTDTYSFFESGAYGTAVFSESKYMIVKEEKSKSESDIISFFPEADIIILEGMKYSRYPKFEVIRSTVSNKSVCEIDTVLAVISDLTQNELGIRKRVIDINDVDDVLNIVIENIGINLKGYSGIILAGGKSSRMGRDKSDLNIRDKTFLEMQVEKLNSIGIEDIVISGYKGKKQYENIINDELEDKGPLGGIYTCLNRIKNDKCIVIPVDVPFISENVLKNIIIRNIVTDSNITCLSHNGIIEPLISVYSKNLSDSILSFIHMEEYSVKAFLSHYGFDSYICDKDENLFKNINYYKQYTQIGE